MAKRQDDKGGGRSDWKGDGGQGGGSNQKQDERSWQKEAADWNETTSRGKQNLNRLHNEKNDENNDAGNRQAAQGKSGRGGNPRSRTGSESGKD